MSGATTEADATRRIVVVLDRAVASAARLALLDVAASMAASSAAALDVLDLHGTAASTDRLPRGFPVETTWWDCSDEHAGDAASAATAASAVQALREARLLDDARCLVILPASDGAEAEAASIAAAIDALPLGRCVDLRIAQRDVVAERDAFGGRVRIGLTATADRVVATLRPVAGEAVANGADVGRPAVRRALSLRAGAVDALPGEMLPSADSRAAVDGAKLIVSGGRGIGSADGFELLARLADRLGGAFGGSLPAVDAGWIPAARQIGQSGKFVSPATYLAIAISGTPQHLAGISDEARLIAINNDADASIFGVAQVGVVADWKDIVPRLIALIDGRRSGR